MTGTIKMQDAWAAGVRVGYLVAPNVLSYVNGGYSGSHWSGTTLLDTFSGAPVGGHTDSFNRNGWFIGGGVENNLNIFGITAPGWFMKTEYRSAFYDTEVRRSSWSTAPICLSVAISGSTLEPDHLDLAGLPLQLGWPGRREVLISLKSSSSKAPASSGAFLLPVTQQRRLQPRSSPSGHDGTVINSRLAGGPGIVFDRELAAAFAMFTGDA